MKSGAWKVGDDAEITLVNKGGRNNTFIYSSDVDPDSFGSVDPDPEV